MEIAKWIEISEVVVGVLGIAYGYYEYRQRHKLSKVVKVHLVADTGDLAKIHESCHNAWVTTKLALEEVSKLPNSPEQQTAIKLIGSTIGDIRAGKDMSINLFNQLLAFQKAQFDTRNADHPQSATLTLMKAEAESQLKAAERGLVPQRRKRWWMSSKD
jgi:hypothetical protein